MTRTAALRLEHLCSPPLPPPVPRSRKELLDWRSQVWLQAWDMREHAPRCPGCRGHVVQRRCYGPDMVEVMCARDCGWRCVQVEGVAA